jgi:hypothetical protein
MAWAGMLAVIALAMALGSARAQEKLDFNRQIRPILSAHCFKCHGPDENVREAGLRLDLREAAIKEADSGATAIVAGQPGKSELVRRIFSSDQDEMMPPQTANKPLTEEQKGLLRQWIAEGAEYQAHWAFIPPRQATPQNSAAARQPIDAFVQARLAQAKLKLSPEADRYTLIRRVSLDLIGLPPSVEEADAFASKIAPDAYERLVDRLLAAPQYGERWGRKWLDLARYADTNGYEKDRVRSMWPYRDWVIRALNADMPFDQFTVEQLAGDMLPGATLAQQIATGFHRNTMINEEGGIDPLEFRYYAMVDRVNTTATVWMGLTLGCAQCHTHKFDPIPHADYYRQMAFLNNADEPMVDVPEAEVDRKQADIEREIAALVADLPNRFPAAEGRSASEHLEAKFVAWLKAENEKAVKWTLVKPTKAVGQMPTLHILDDGSVYSTGDITKRDVYDVTLDTAGLSGVTALRIEAMTDPRLPKNGPGRIYYEGPMGDFWLSEVTAGIHRSPHAPREEFISRSRPAERVPRTTMKFKSASHSFAAGKNTAEAAIDGDPQTGWSINGGQGRTHFAVFQFEQPLAEASAIELKLLFERYYAGAMGRFRVWATTDPRGGEARDLPHDVEELFLVPPDQLSAQQRERLVKQFVLIAPELKAEHDKIKKLRDSIPAQPTTLVMQERPVENRRVTQVHHRGEFLQAKDEVEPGLLSIFAPVDDGQPHDRLSYARWLVSPANPLVGRATMNRQWAALFGTGIVRTTEDFGYQGEPPSHPELLDWLAVELMRRGWSMKAMHRLLVTSATYRQSSSVTPESTAADPQNRLLSRLPRGRLEAEVVRDVLLRASGLLSLKLGGASVFPPQPAGITSEGAYGPLAWNVSTGEDRFRRGLYTFAKRTTPYAMFATFDGPSGEACVARREVSNTPLQALTMLNDAIVVEAAQALGRELAASALASDDDRLQWLFRRVVTRPAASSELNLLKQFLETQRRRLTAKEIDAGQIAGEGEGHAVERAAWTLVARAILNLDEVITKE